MKVKTCRTCGRQKELTHFTMAELKCNFCFSRAEAAKRKRTENGRPYELKGPAYWATRGL